MDEERDMEPFEAYTSTQRPASTDFGDELFAGMSAGVYPPKPLGRC